MLFISLSEADSVLRDCSWRGLGGILLTLPVAEKQSDNGRMRSAHQQTLEKLIKSTKQGSCPPNKTDVKRWKEGMERGKKEGGK